MLVKLLCLLLGSLAVSAQKKPVSKPAASWPAVAVFGDSLSDTGNWYAISNKTTPKPIYGYFKGRYTNAPGTWVDHMQLGSPGLQILNYAVGGATACPMPPLAYLAFPVLNKVPYLSQQVDRYQAKVASDPALKAKSRMAVIWLGGNDLLVSSYLPPGGVFFLPKNISDCIMAGATRLLDSGVNTVVLAVLPPVDLSPGAILGNSTEIAKLAINAANAYIKVGAAALQVKYPGRKVIFWEMAEVRDMITNFKKFGYKYTSPQSCVRGPNNYSAFQGTKPTSVCKDPNAYTFYDPTHPSSKSHRAVLMSLVTALRNNKAFWK